MESKNRGTRPKYSASHHENRLKICCVCGFKCNLNSRGKWPAMSDNLIKSVKCNYPSYNPLDELFPLSICTTCRIKVSSHMAKFA